MKIVCAICGTKKKNQDSIALKCLTYCDKCKDYTSNRAEKKR